MIGLMVIVAVGRFIEMAALTAAATATATAAFNAAACSLSIEEWWKRKAH